MARYELGVVDAFSAKHYLIGGDFGPENDLHAHDYRVEVVLEGDDLDRHGFLVDIDRVKGAISGLVSRFDKQTLNDVPELSGLNPSCEHFARLFADGVCARLDGERSPQLSGLTVKIWEDAEAWASFRVDLNKME